MKKVMTMKFSEGWKIFKDYCLKRGATKKVVGDYAFKSPRYRQQPPRGIMIRLKEMPREGNYIKVYDSKKGIITIGPDGSILLPMSPEYIARGWSKKIRRKK